MMESVVTLAMILQRFDIHLAMDPSAVGMRTGTRTYRHPINRLYFGCDRTLLATCSVEVK